MRPGIGAERGRAEVLLIGGVEGGGEGELLEVVAAIGDARGFLGAGECGEKQAGKDGDNGNNHQQFDKSEPCPALHWLMVAGLRGGCKDCGIRNVKRAEVSKIGTT